MIRPDGLTAVGASASAVQNANTVLSCNANYFVYRLILAYSGKKKIPTHFSFKTKPECLKMFLNETLLSRRMPK